MQAGRVERRADSGIVVAALANGSTNAIDPEIVRRLSLLLAQAAEDPEVEGLVLAGAGGKFFSIGFDIPKLYPLSREEFEPFFAAFNRLCLDLYAFPKPTVAAIAGHAVAGGCILSICCDRRIVADGRTLMGLNTVKLGVPVPLVVQSILGRLLGARRAADLVAAGDFHAGEELLRLGLADEARPAGSVIEAAVDTARSLGAASLAAYAEAKRARAAEVLEEVEPALEERNRAFVDAWYAPPARQLLREAMGRFRREPHAGP